MGFCVSSKSWSREQKYDVESMHYRLTKLGGGIP